MRINPILKSDIKIAAPALWIVPLPKFNCSQAIIIAHTSGSFIGIVFSAVLRQ
nr:MAG TPA: hypothetical protein [Bacteriophage sp.]